MGVKNQISEIKRAFHDFYHFKMFFLTQWAFVFWVTGKHTHSEIKKDNYIDSVLATRLLGFNRSQGCWTGFGLDVKQSCKISTLWNAINYYITEHKLQLKEYVFNII